MNGSRRIAIYPYIDCNPYQFLLSQALEKRGYKVLKLPSINDRLPARILFECREVDVLHLHWCEGLYEARSRLSFAIRTLVFMLALIILRCLGTRIVYTLHNLVPHDTDRPRVHAFVRKLIVRVAHHTIVHSQAALDAAAAALGAKAKFMVIPHGHYRDVYPNEISSAQARSALRLPPEMRIALFFGSLHEKYKCVRALLNTAEELHRRRILLLIAGETSKLDDADRKLLRQVTAKREVVLHEGFIPDSKVQLYMKAADCLVVPYSNSLTSGVATLGLSFNLPIVGTNAVAFKELIDRGLCLPCNPMNSVSVVEAIEAVCAWPREEFEVRCNDFLASCAWDEIAERQLSAYRYRPPRSAPKADPKGVRLEEAPEPAHRNSSL